MNLFERNFAELSLNHNTNHTVTPVPPSQQPPVPPFYPTTTTARSSIGTLSANATPFEPAYAFQNFSVSGNSGSDVAPLQSTYDIGVEEFDTAEGKYPLLCLIIIVKDYGGFAHTTV